MGLDSATEVAPVEVGPGIPMKPGGGLAAILCWIFLLPTEYIQPNTIDVVARLFATCAKVRWLGLGR